jgi:UDP-N-acetylglucosamine diphosphorylase/glucosamine-1-phosphate N-acetyltransferase
VSDKKAAIILAAGKGERMKSDTPKVLHEVKGRPLIDILMETLTSMDFDRIVVVIGYKGEMVQKALEKYPISFVWQKEQLGTGHAVMMAREALADFDGVTLVALGDVPFLSETSINQLLASFRDTKAVASCLSAILDDPKGYGRVVREGDSDILKAIVEQKDASEEVLRINEINSGTFCFDTRQLFEALDQIGNENTQGEYYLTDTIKVMNNNGLRVSVVAAEDPDEVRGVNSAAQLEYLARHFADKLR